MTADYEKSLLEHYKTIRTYLYRYTSDRQLAEDLTQDAYIRAIKHVRARGPPQEPLAWLRAIAKNVALSHLMRSAAGADHHADSLDASVLMGDFEDPLDEAANAEAHRYMTKVLGHAVAALGKLDRELIQGHYYFEKGYRALSSEATMDYAAVKARLHRARQKMKKHLLRSTGFETDSGS